MIENKIIFLSHFINAKTPVYGGESDSIKLEQIRSISKGDTSNNLKVNFPVHVSTHIDFPYHFDEKGKKCSDYSASNWIFQKIGFIKCSVDDIENNISNLSQEIECLILKTGFEQYRGSEKYWKEQPVIYAKLANIFKNQFPKLRLFGFDMISLTSKLNRTEGKKAHAAFLIENDILILEDMHLNFLETAPTLLIVSPLLIDEADGSPCNVIAFFE